MKKNGNATKGLEYARAALDLTETPGALKAFYDIIFQSDSKRKKLFYKNMKVHNGKIYDPVLSPSASYLFFIDSLGMPFLKAITDTSLNDLSFPTIEEEIIAVYFPKNEDYLVAINASDELAVWRVDQNQ